MLCALAAQDIGLEKPEDSENGVDLSMSICSCQMWLCGMLSGNFAPRLRG